MDVKLLDETVEQTKTSAMAPSTTPVRSLVRPRSLSLNICRSIPRMLKTFDNRSNTNDREEPVKSNSPNYYNADSKSPPGSGNLRTTDKSTPLRTISERGRRGKRRMETSLTFLPAPSSVIDRPQMSKVALRKVPSTPTSTTILVPSNNHSSKTAVSVSVSSPTSTNKSRSTLPTSPVASGSANQKKLALDDQNPFGADLVRYQNGVHLVAVNRTTSNNGKVILENSSSNIFRSEAEDAPFLGNLKERREISNRKWENHVESSRKDLEKATGANAWGAYAAGGTGFLRNRFSTRRIRNRLMQKDGECNISLHNVPKQRSKYFADIFTTLVEVKWRWCLLIFALGFLLSWLLFAVIYYLVMLSHGDFNQPPEDKNWKFCVRDVRNFVSVFMFSLESQHTIGYGSRYPTEECPAIVATVCLQSMVGVMIQTFMAGIVFAKLARAKKRAETLIFSKHAVVCMRDGKLCFLFRVGDMRKSQLAEAHVRLQMISKRITNEGELLPFHQFDMNVGYDAGLDRIFVVWPITICHVIDESSPLYEYSADDLTTARFEIIAILEGVVPSTGTTTQARTSYLPQEIIWGSRFEKLVTYQRENGEYRIDFSKFHTTYAQETPMCSARDLDLLREAGLNLEEVYHVEGDEQAENQGLTPYSTVDSRVDSNRPTILPPKEECSPSLSAIESDPHPDHPPTSEDGDDETGRLLPQPPSTAALITMSPAERKASIAAAAAAFRKNKSLSETARKASLAAYNKIRKPSIKVGMADDSPSPNGGKTTGAATPTPVIRILRHASSTGSVPVNASFYSPPGCNMKSRPSSILREHDIM